MADKRIVRGILLTCISAALFGITPVLASRTYEMGSNPLTLTFYRNLMAVPVLAVLMAVRKIPFSLTGKELGQLAVIGVGFRASTTFMLYASYSYIGIGTATTLHFLYPLFTALVSLLLFRQRLGWKKSCALGLAVIGIGFFADFTGGSLQSCWPGLLLAIASSMTYSGYMTGMEHSVLRDMDATKVACYMALSNAAAVFLINLPLGQIRFFLPPKAMLYTLIVSICTSFLAFALLQLGIRELGATTAALFCLLEPITSILSGVRLLGEEMTLRKAAGCLLVLGAVVLTLLSGNDRQEEKE
jgi:drug/metabolite transporter (DMT)-like permease